MKIYADKKSTEFKVGIFTIVALIILVLSYSWLQEVLESRKYTKIKVGFPNAANIEVGSSVTINGVKKGRVESINVTEAGAELVLLVELDFTLKAGTEFSILESNLMGEVQVEIEPGAGNKNLDFTKILNGNRHYGITKLVAELSEIVYGLKDVMSAIAGDDNIVKDFQAIIDTSQTMLNKMNNLLDKNDDKVTELLENSSRASSQLAQLIDSNQDNISNTFLQTQEVLTKFNVALQEVQTMTRSVQSISDKVLKSDSSLNSLLTEKELYDNLINASASLDSLLVDIKKNPKDYFKIKVF